MIFVFKKTGLQYFILTFAVIFFVIMSRFPLQRSGTYYYGIWGDTAVTNLPAAYVISILLAFCAALIVAVVFEIIAQAKFQKTLKLLYDELDPDRFLRSIESIIQRVDGLNDVYMTSTPFTLQVSVYYAQGLYEAGQIDKAIKVLEATTHHKKIQTKSGANVKGGAYMILQKYYYLQGNFDAMSRCTTEVKNIYAKYGKGLNKKNLELYCKKIAAANCLYLGENKKALEFYSTSLEKGKSRLERIYSHCNLAEIYGALGETELSEAYLLVALEQAPNLFTVTDTQLRLCQASK